MASVGFDNAELERINEICERFDPATHELTSHFIAQIPGADERSIVIDYYRKCVRGELIMGSMQRAVHVAGIALGVSSLETYEQALADEQEHRVMGGSFRPEQFWKYDFNFFSPEAARVHDIIGRSGLRDDFKDAINLLKDMAHSEMFPETFDLLVRRELELNERRDSA